MLPFYLLAVAGLKWPKVVSYYFILNSLNIEPQDIPLYKPLDTDRHNEEFQQFFKKFPPNTKLINYFDCII